MSTIFGTNRTGSVPDEDNKAATTSEEAKNQDNDGSVGANGESSKPIATEGTLENGGKSIPEQTTDNENFPGQDMKNVLDQDSAANAVAASNAESDGDRIATDAVLSGFFSKENEISKEQRSTFKRPSKASTPEDSTEELKPIAAYKHREVNHFKIGPFEFRRHILEIYSEAAHDAFLQLYQGLTPRDQSAIVEYDIEAAARVEKPVQVARGSLGTADIKDPKAIQ